MVTRVLAAAFIALLMLASAATHAAGKLTVEPDRTRLYEGEVLTLTVKGSMKLDINLTNLFSFDLSQLPSPDIEKVEPDFEILARNQHYSVQTVNTEMVGEITWTYQLAPSRTGTLSLPSLTFKDAVSDPLEIEVVAGTPPDQAASRTSFIELSADKAEVYVQEQLVLTVRLFFSGNLIRGELSEPEHPDAIIESLGQQKESTRYRDGIRYRVVERRYAIFPQTPGTLSLAPIRFDGQSRDASGQLRFLRDQQQLYDVPVKAVPAEYPMDQAWLPASKVTLSDEGLPSGQELIAGSNLNHKITLEADGLPSEALPPIVQDMPGAIRSYPEQPIRNTETTPSGLRSALQQTAALVPVQTGDVIVPAIRIPWWNTETNTLEEAVLPARHYTVSGNSALPAAASSPETSTPAEGPASEPTANVDTAQRTGSGDSRWLWATGIFAALWLITLGLWWRARQAPSGKQESHPAADDSNERQAFEALKNAINEGSGQTSRALLRWARLKFPERDFGSVHDLLRFAGNQPLNDAFERFQATLYSGQQHGEHARERTDLVKALQTLRETSGKNQTRSQELPPLYPSSLTS
ncbi:BatD family protein [Marinobacter daepoensis]|uniref:Protein BatD n=1 Tax=Marinobacter daepoensis TaxID=262077 RepID=A0ABS3BDD9_9GAMM|nr:BatD family protein [Marinobacter daepoensis]MBN7769573.1 protein BatD [Marinobacter daepoensis]MBY6078263.1 BatD family protein [Marinobacter daepoensis]